MSEKVRLGRVACDFMGQYEFEELCSRWLTSDRFNHVVTLNPEMVMLAEHDDAFRKAVSAAEVRAPDGAGLIWARWYLRSRWWPLWPSLIAFLRQPVERVTGIEAVMMLGRLCHKRGLSLYLLGGTARQRRLAATMLTSRFVGLTVGSSSEDLADINRQQPAVLLVAYGAPKQTLWVERHRNNLPNVRIAVGVGGAFAILGEDLPRAPKRLQALNLEWLWRLYLEPRRLPRIWQATVQFPLLISRQKKHGLDKLA